MGVHTDLGDVAPRVGFALSLKHGMVVRGGFGMSYWPGNTSGNSLGQNAPFTGNFGCGEEPYSAQPCTGQFSAGNGRSLLSAGMPPPPYGVLNDALATNPANYLGTALLSVEPNFRASYVEQYSLQFEKEIAGNILSIGYVGNQGRRVVNYPNINQPGTSTSPYPFPALPGVTIQWWSSAGNTQYNAMQLSLQRRLSHGLTASANYTYSSATGNISVSGESQGGENLDCAVFTCLEDNPANPSEPKIVKGWQQYDQGNSDIDVTSRFTTMINYQLPFGKSLRGAAAQAGRGWAVNLIGAWQTGLPFTVVNTGAISGIKGLGSDRPDQIGSVSLSNPTRLEWFNTAAFATQTPGTLGDEKKGAVFGPPQRRIDFSVFKDFPIREPLRLQFRAEFFNLTNTANFAPPAYALGAAGFGVISATNPLATPREIQFVLKLLF